MDQIPLAVMKHVTRGRIKLIELYCSQEHSTDAWPPLKIVSFVHLTLVKPNKRERHIGLQTIRDDMYSAYGQKASVEFHSLFENLEHRSTVLVEGRPGSGKTTLMIKISCDWANTRILYSKQLVLFVRLRQLNRLDDVNLYDLVRVSCIAFSHEEVENISLYIETRLGEDVVFVLDGFDEYAPGANKDNFISKLIMKEVFFRSIVIVSSRPAATQRFRLTATKWIEVVGFMKKQVIEYVDTYFNDNENLAKKLKKHLQHHPNLMNMCYLPLHCSMLVYLYEVEEFLPETETEFYEHFTLSTLIRSIRKRDEDPNRPFQLSSYIDLPLEEKSLFEKICQLAFQATVKSQQVLSLSDLYKVYSQFKGSISANSLGLVVIDRYYVRYGLNETYSFIHLTFQEHLAAVHIANLGESDLLLSTIATVLQSCGQSLPLQSGHGQTKQMSTLTTSVQQDPICLPNKNLATETDVEHHHHENAKKFNVVFKFLLGMIDFSNNNAMDIFKLILERNNDDILYCLACAFETQHPSACNCLLRDNTLHISQSHKCDEVTFSSSMNSALDVNTLNMMHIAYVIVNAGSFTPKVHFDNCYFDSEAAIALLQRVGDHQFSLIIE